MVRQLNKAKKSPSLARSQPSFQLAIGMKVVIMNNIETKLDIANGARGIVERIIVDQTEGHMNDSSTHIQVLSRPPVCVLVRLERTKVSSTL